jgi:hypothetical protein
VSIYGGSVSEVEEEEEGDVCRVAWCRWPEAVEIFGECVRD